MTRFWPEDRQISRILGSKWGPNGVQNGVKQSILGVFLRYFDPSKACIGIKWGSKRVDFGVKKGRFWGFFGFLGVKKPKGSPCVLRKGSKKGRFWGQKWPIFVSTKGIPLVGTKTAQKDRRVCYGFSPSDRNLTHFWVRGPEFRVFGVLPPPGGGGSGRNSSTKKNGVFGPRYAKLACFGVQMGSKKGQIWVKNGSK